MVDGCSMVAPCANSRGVGGRRVLLPYTVYKALADMFCEETILKTSMKNINHIMISYLDHSRGALSGSP